MEQLPSETPYCFQSTPPTFILLLLYIEFHEQQFFHQLFSPTIVVTALLSSLVLHLSQSSCSVNTLKTSGLGKSSCECLRVVVHYLQSEVLRVMPMGYVVVRTHSRLRVVVLR